MGSPTPVVLQNRGDVAQRGSDGVGLVVDLVILVVFSSLNDSMILHLGSFQ